MPMKKKFNGKIPPCPDPNLFTLVKSKYGYYWRRNRGTVKPAVLNDVLQKSAAITATANRASKQVMDLLAVYTQRMSLGTASSRISGAFKKSYLEKGKIDFSYLPGIQFQEDYRIDRLYSGMVTSAIEKGTIHIRVGYGQATIKQHIKRNECYQFTAIMLYGDPMKERGIKIETDETPIFYFKDHPVHEYCYLSLILPAKKRPWIVLIHLACKMEKRIYAGSKYHAMWVVTVG